MTQMVDSELEGMMEVFVKEVDEKAEAARAARAEATNKDEDLQHQGNLVREFAARTGMQAQIAVDVIQLQAEIAVLTAEYVKLWYVEEGAGRDAALEAVRYLRATVRISYCYTSVFMVSDNVVAG